MGRSGPPGDILRHDLDLVRYLPVGGGRQYLQCGPAGDSAGARRPVCGFNLGDQCVSARGHDGAAAVLDARGELYSYKKVYLSGVAVFTAASALCTFSHTLLMLTVSRAVQGLGAAMIMSVNTSIAMLIAAVLTLCSALFSFLRIRTKTS